MNEPYFWFVTALQAHIQLPFMSICWRFKSQKHKNENLSSMIIIIIINRHLQVPRNIAIRHSFVYFFSLSLKSRSCIWWDSNICIAFINISYQFKSLLLIIWMNDIFVEFLKKKMSFLFRIFHWEPLKYQFSYSFIIYN